MARLSEIDRLHARKQALVAQSEVYRQMLRLEVQNLSLYAAHWQRRLDRWRAYKPLFLAMPLLGSFLTSTFRRRSQPKPKTGWRRLFATALVGWRLYRRFGPLLRQLVEPYLRRPSRTQPTVRKVE